MSLNARVVAEIQNTDNFILLKYNDIYNSSDLSLIYILLK